MESSAFVEKLMELNLTRQEALVYDCLLNQGKTTGYEVAKLLCISRSNAYNTLEHLTEKGAACVAEEGNVRKYVPVPLSEFVHNRLHHCEETGQWLLAHQPSVSTKETGYITIEGAGNIEDKIRNLLSNVKKKAYISCTSNDLLLFVEELEKLDHENQLVIITDRAIKFGRAKVYVGEPRDTQIGLIIDNQFVLTGEFGEGSLNTCLYSGQKNFVELYRRSLSNEIKLLEIQERRTRRDRVRT